MALANAGTAFSDVRKYGAVGDGTTDDTASIQITLDKASARGGIIYVPPGVYRIAEALRIYSNQTMYLDPGARILRGSNTNAMLLNASDGSIGGYGASSNIHIIGGTWDANRDEFPTMCTMVAIGHADNILIERTTFRNLHDWHMIEFNAVRNGKVLDCIFENYGSDTVGTEMIQLDISTGPTLFPWFGPYDNFACSSITIENCIFRRGVIAIGSHSYSDTLKHHNVNIIRNHFEDMSGEAIRMINYENVDIEGNTFVDVWKAVVGTVTATTQIYDVNIIRNKIIRADRDGESRAIQLISSNTGGKFVGGTVSENYVNTGGRHGIGLDFCENFSITNNTVTGCRQAGIWVYGSKQTRLVDNRAYGNNVTSAANRSDILVGYVGTTSDTVNTTIIGNIVDTIIVNTSSNTIVTNNIVGGSILSSGTNDVYHAGGNIINGTVV